jgi:hypothetical protein
MPKPAYTLALFLIALLIPVSNAHAQSRGPLDDPYWAAKLTFGFGGSATSSFEANGTTFSADRSLEVSFGAAGQYLHPLHQYFSLGGLFGIQTWRSTADGAMARK